jgi:hypothetical protein
MTPRSLINSSLRAIGAIQANEVPTNDMFEDARELLNMLMDSWSAEELLPHDYIQESYTLSSGVANYTIGSGVATGATTGIVAAAAASGTTPMTINAASVADPVIVASGVATLDIPRHVVMTVSAASNSAGITLTVAGTNTYGDVISESFAVPTSGGGTIHGTKQFKTVTSVTPSATTTSTIAFGVDAIINIRRPIKIVDAFVRSSTTDTPVYAAARERYNELSAKSTTGTPTRFYYDRLYPSGEIYLYPVPAVATLTLYLDLWLPFVTIASTALDTAINLPGEYILAFRWNLAAELAPEYGKEVKEFVFVRAQETKNTIRKLNSLPPKPLNLKTPMAVIDGQPAANSN